MESLDMNPEFWRGRRVFVTGHTGFKGSWLCLWLQMMGAEVHGYALPPPTSPSLFELARVGQHITSIEGDVRDLRHLKASLITTDAEIVFHLAAQPIVRLSYTVPVDTYMTNVIGTVNLLEAVRTTGRPRVVVCVTTDKCYENLGGDHPFSEQDRLGGHDPYSNSKACAELVCSAYRDSFFGAAGEGAPTVSLATARAGNVIGGGDFAEDRLIPDILRALVRGEVVSVRHPQSVRPWQHVLEPLRGYLMLAEQLHAQGPAFAQAWNFGPDKDDCKTVSWIVEEMARRWPVGAAWRLSPGTHPHEAQMLRLDIDKAKRHLAWMPALRLTQALDLVIDWHVALEAGADMQEVTTGQIAAYQCRINHRSEAAFAA
jgi:CDP-glucose 4,6-dehydratase